MAEKMNGTLEDEANGNQKPVLKDKSLCSKVKEKGSSFNDRGICLRADKIDFKDWDCQLAKHLNKVMSRESTFKKREVWEIDSSKLDIKRAIDHGAYGTVYRGIYDGQDVAGKFFNLFFLFMNGILCLCQSRYCCEKFLDKLEFLHEPKHVICSLDQ